MKLSSLGFVVFTLALGSVQALAPPPDPKHEVGHGPEHKPEHKPDHGYGHGPSPGQEHQQGCRSILQRKEW
jgi:hypothetical protein